MSTSQRPPAVVRHQPTHTFIANRHTCPSPTVADPSPQPPNTSTVSGHACRYAIALVLHAAWQNELNSMDFQQHGFPAVRSSATQEHTLASVKLKVLRVRSCSSVGCIRALASFPSPFTRVHRLRTRPQDEVYRLNTRAGRLSRFYHTHVGKRKATPKGRLTCDMSRSKKLSAKAASRTTLYYSVSVAFSAFFLG